MRKFILHASMAFILSSPFIVTTPYAVADNDNGSQPFQIEIEGSDLCARGRVGCTYLFTADKGTGDSRHINMIRRPNATFTPDPNDWVSYQLPISTKSQVQAGYFIDVNPNTYKTKVVLIVVYSADKEGKGGAIVSRISRDFGRTWSASKNITDKKHVFGLAVAPGSFHVATRNNEGKIRLHRLTWIFNKRVGRWRQTWQINPSKKGSARPSSEGLSVIYDFDLRRVGVNYVGSGKVRDLSYDIATNKWKRDKTAGWHYKYDGETAWLYKRANNPRHLSVTSAHDRAHGGDEIVTRTTSDLQNFNHYTWDETGKKVSGIWHETFQDKIYVLYLKENTVWGMERDYDHIEDDQSIEDTILYQSENAMQRRISMFNVPEKILAE